MPRTSFRTLLHAACLFTIAAPLLPGQLLTPVWVELGENGRAIARVVVNRGADCPGIQIDNAAPVPMNPREPVPEGLRPVCEAAIPAAAKSARVGEQRLALPHADPVKVAVFGDTGCRIKGKRLQDCKDPGMWPFHDVAAKAAAARPDLMIHVGDFLYREDPCPASADAKCGGTPSGDNWPAWDADFFAPAADLLRAAPWAFSRGNHEDCGRSWRGWFYYLDPRPWTGGCEAYSDPYVIKLGRFELVMFDSSATREDELNPDQVAKYTAQLASIHLEAGSHAWLVDHHPFWSLKPGEKDGPLRPLSLPLEAAWDQAKMAGVDMVVSGHTHLFAVMGFGGKLPVQIVAGDGGTALSAPIPESVNGQAIHGASVMGSETRTQFGYTILERAKASSDVWNLTLHALDGAALLHCSVHGRTEDCSVQHR